MTAPSEDASDVRRLQRCIADLVSVLALPAMWAGAEPSRVVHTLADALIGMLHLDLAYVCARKPGSEGSLETARLAQQPGAPPDSDLVCTALRERWGSDPLTWPRRARTPFGDAELWLAPLPLGLHGEIGVLVAGSRRADFPAETERLVLSVAANQAVIGLQEACLLAEQRKARDELSRGVVFREQLMGILGHDLRNPLSAVYGMAEKLERDASLSHGLRDRARLILQASTRMSEMIDTILDFTRIRFDDQGLPVVRATMDLAELSREVIDEALAAQPARQVSLETSGDLRGNWDRARLAQVLSNLLGNALTHGDATQPVHVSARSDAMSVTIEVTNRGPTIAPDRMESLFEPFVRGAGSNQDARRHGLGLGLYIARQIVASHGGNLDGRSLDGTTTFTVVLPRTL